MDVLKGNSALNYSTLDTDRNQNKSDFAFHTVFMLEVMYELYVLDLIIIVYVFKFAGEESENGEEEDEIVKGGGYEDEDQSMVDSDGVEKEDDDFDPDTGGGKKKKKSKKHKSKGDDKKSKKKKKRKKAESEPSDVEEEPPVEEQTASKKKVKPSKAAAPASGGADSGMPSVEEVCSTFGLTDVEIDYEDSEYQNLNNYKLFQQHVRPLLQKENPKVDIFID